MKPPAKLWIPLALAAATALTILLWPRPEHRPAKPEADGPTNPRNLPSALSTGVREPDQAAPRPTGGPDPVATFAPPDPGRLRQEWDRQKTEEDQDRFLADLVPLWSEKDPRACLAFLASLPDVAPRDYWLQETLAAWAEQDPRVAVAAAAAYSPPGANPELDDRIAGAFARRSPQEAVVWARSLKDPAVAEALLEAVLVAWAEQDPTAALQTIAGSDWAEDQQVASALVGAATTLAERDGPAAARWAIQQMNASGQSELYGAALSTWAANDPSAAAAFAETQSPPDAKRDALAAVAGTWASTDPNAAARWASGLKNSSDRATSCAELAGAWVENQPVEAFRWAAAIQTDGITRQAALNALATRLQTMPEAYREMTRNLSAEELKTLRPLVEPGQ